MTNWRIILKISSDSYKYLSRIEYLSREFSLSPTQPLTFEHLIAIKLVSLGVSEKDIWEYSKKHIMNDVCKNGIVNAIEDMENGSFVPTEFQKGLADAMWELQ